MNKGKMVEFYFIVARVGKASPRVPEKVPQSL